MPASKFVSKPAMEVRENVCAVAAAMREIPGMEARVLHKSIRHARMMQAKEDERGQSFKTRGKGADKEEEADA